MVTERIPPLRLDRHVVDQIGIPFHFGPNGLATGDAANELSAISLGQRGPARRLAVAAVAAEMVATAAIHRRLGTEAMPLASGRAGRLMRAASALVAGGATLATLFGRRSRIADAAGGAALVVGSACTRLGVFHAGVAAAQDPAYTVRAQRSAPPAPIKD